MNTTDRSSTWASCLVIAGLVLAGCHKSSNDSVDHADAGSVRDPSGKLTKAGFKDAWNAVYMSAAAASQPSEGKKKALLARVGPPARVEGGKSIWYGIDGADCFEIELTESGMMGTSKVPNDKCGL
jgi:hypothetical protein